MGNGRRKLHRKDWEKQYTLVERAHPKSCIFKSACTNTLPHCFKNEGKQRPCYRRTMKIRYYLSTHITLCKTQWPVPTTITLSNIIATIVPSHGNMWDPFITELTVVVLHHRSDLCLWILLVCDTGRNSQCTWQMINATILILQGNESSSTAAASF